MIRTILYETAADRIDSGGEELVQRWNNDPQSILWLDIGNHSTDDVSRLLGEEFGIHPLAVSDALRERHPPKFEAFDNYTFLLFKGLSADSGNIDCSSIQMALFIGERFLITRHSGESPSTEQLRDETFGGGSRIARGPARWEKGGNPGYGHKRPRCGGQGDWIDGPDSEKHVGEEHPRTDGGQYPQEEAEAGEAEAFTHHPT